MSDSRMSGFTIGIIAGVISYNVGRIVGAVVSAWLFT